MWSKQGLIKITDISNASQIQILKDKNLPQHFEVKCFSKCFVLPKADLGPAFQGRIAVKMNALQKLRRKSLRKSTPEIK